MSIAPASLTALGNYWRSKGGQNLGIVGSRSHTSGYHLGKDRIYDGAGPGRGAADYSVKLPRDKAGLTNYVSAIDLGHANKAKLRAFSVWLVKQCQLKTPGYSNIKEIIYSPNGIAVRRWDAVTRKVYVAGDGTGQGDNSHRWHTHISYYRDTRTQNLVALFARYFGVTTTTKPPVPKAKVASNVAVAAGSNLSRIAAAHGMSLKTLLAFPGNEKYRENPSLVFKGNIVQVGWK